MENPIVAAKDTSISWNSGLRYSMTIITKKEQVAYKVTIRIEKEGGSGCLLAAVATAAVGGSSSSSNNISSGHQWLCFGREEMGDVDS